MNHGWGSIVTKAVTIPPKKDNSTEVSNKLLVSNDKDVDIVHTPKPFVDNTSINDDKKLLDKKLRNESLLDKFENFTRAEQVLFYPIYLNQKL